MHSFKLCIVAGSVRSPTAALWQPGSKNLGLADWPLSANRYGSFGSIAANSTRFGRARSSDEKIVLEPRLKVTVEDSLRHNMRLPFDASVETTKT